MSDLFVRIKGDVFVNVPPSPHFLTTYVLLEQEDWFEKEIRFIRNFLKPGMHAVDVGASYGVYALTMAKAVDPGGSVTAFEPAPATAAMLRKSIARNGLHDLRLVAMALSAREGKRTLNLYDNSELNSLSRPKATPASRTEQVDVSTLDLQQAILHWPAIDFVKIDAEGEELNIVAGGRTFFAENSPLVMFEIVDASAERTVDSIVPAFRELGYDAYRLIGPDELLVPLAVADPAVGFEYNLFACKPDRAAQLRATGMLATESDVAPEFARGAGEALFRRQPFAAAFGSLSSRDGAYEQALDAYAIWRDRDAAPELRCAGLKRALAGMREAVQARQSLARYCSLARCAIEAGERTIAVEAINRVLNILVSTTTALPEEPFFPVTKRYDAVDPKRDMRSWLLASAFEAAETLSAPTGYFQTPHPKMRELHNWLAATPFISAEMERRRQLHRLRAGEQTGIVAAPVLAQTAADNLNAELWTSGDIG